MMSEESDTRLQKAFHSLSEAARPREDCPAPEALWAALQGESPLQERREIITHTSSCFSCAEEWRLAKVANEEWEQGGREPVADLSFAAPKAVPPPVPARRSAWRPQLLALAAAFGLAVLGLNLYQRSSIPEPVFRQADEESVRSLLANQAELPREHCLLRWSAAAAGVRYDLLVTTEDLKVVFRAEDLETTEYLIPEATFEDLGSETRFLWRIGLTFADGSRQESATFDLRLDAPEPAIGGGEKESEKL